MYPNIKPVQRRRRKLKRNHIRLFTIAATMLAQMPAFACQGSNDGGLQWVSEWLAGRHYVVGSGDARETRPQDNAVEYWRGHRMYETSVAVDTICDTQMYLNVNYPNFGTTESWYSDKQNGCSWIIQVKVAPQAFDGCYGSSVYFGYWWFSNATGSAWNEIGVMSKRDP
jgi:hypothetical protein